MQHAVFTLFPDAPSADAAVKEVVDADLIREDNLSVIVHKEQFELRNPADLSETDAAPSLRRGFVLGATIGSIVGALLGGPLGIIAAGPLAGALFGAGGGALYASLGAVLAGAGLPDQSLKRLAEGLEEGKVLVTFKTDHQEAEQRVEEIAARHGAEIAAKKRV